MKLSYAITLFVYIFILFFAVALFAQKFLIHETETPAAYSDIVVHTQVPTSGFEVNVSNRTEPAPTIDKTPKFIPPPDISPSFLKGLIINPEEKFSLQDIKQAQLDGANLLVIELNHEIDVNETPAILTKDWKSQVIGMINEAHKDGMLVELRTTSVIGSRFEGPDDFNNYLSKAKKFFKDMGDFAQEYKVYRFTVYTEANGKYNWEDYTNYINNVTQELLISTKYFYKGKVGIGYTYNSLVTDKLNPNINGYDYLIIGKYPSGKYTSTTLYLSELRDVFDRGRMVASTHGVYNVNLGFFGVNTDPSPSYYTPLTVTELDEAGFYAATIPEFSPKVEGITINYITKMYGIKGHDAEYKVQQKFNTL